MRLQRNFTSRLSNKSNHSTRWFCRSNMNHYKLNEYAAMHLTYATEGESSRRAVQMYAKHYYNRQKSQHKMFSRIHQQIFHQYMYDRTEKQSIRTVPIKKAIVQFERKFKFHHTEYYSPVCILHYQCGGYWTEHLHSFLDVNECVKKF